MSCMLMSCPTKDQEEYYEIHGGKTPVSSQPLEDSVLVCHVEKTQYSDKRQSA